MTNEDIVPKKTEEKQGIDWLRLAEIAAIVLLLGVVLYKTHIFGLTQPKLNAAAYCSANPNDAAKCSCLEEQPAQVEFMDSFNTTPDLLQIIRNGTWKQTFPADNKTVVDLGAEINSEGQLTGKGIVRITNLTPNFYLIYKYQEMNKTCLKAQAK